MEKQNNESVESQMRAVLREISRLRDLWRSTGDDSLDSMDYMDALDKLNLDF